MALALKLRLEDALHDFPEAPLLQSLPNLANNSLDFQSAGELLTVRPAATTNRRKRPRDDHDNTNAAIQPVEAIAAVDKYASCRWCCYASRSLKNRTSERL
jgi:hypothetical protein